MCLSFYDLDETFHQKIDENDSAFSPQTLHVKLREWYHVTTIQRCIT